MKHGASQYRAGCRCEVCRDGHRIHQQRLREAARWKEIPESVHGTANGYGYWDCRCEFCRAAKRAANHRDNPIYKARRRAAA